MRTLTVEFSTSTACNLRCKYCYSNHNPNSMTLKTALEFFEKIDEQLKLFNCDFYHISYFGGEPLMNWEIIEKTLPKFKEDKRCKSVVVISNGLLLTQEKVDYLKKYDCGLSWSFDGLWSSNRPLANQKSSLDLYLEKSKLALQLTNSCKVMVSNNSFNTLTENMKFFLDLGINHPDFSLVRDPIYSNKDLEIYKREIRRLGDFIIDENKKRFCSVGFFSLYVLDSILGKTIGKRNHGCFVGSNGCLYSTDGKFWPCERFRSANINPEINKLKKLSNTRHFDKCKNCELYEYCNAGCTFSQMEQSKFENNEPVDVVCELFKITYKEAFRVFDLAGKNYRARILNQVKSIIEYDIESDLILF